jgi:hypothetical protein
MLNNKIQEKRLGLFSSSLQRPRRSPSDKGFLKYSQLVHNYYELLQKSVPNDVNSHHKTVHF